MMSVAYYLCQKKDVFHGLLSVCLSDSLFQSFVWITTKFLPNVVEVCGFLIELVDETLHEQL